MRDKVITYVYSCWYGVRCHERKDIERIIDEVIAENPDIKDFTKLGVIAKRRCQGEL